MVDAPKDMVGWLQQHPYLQTSKPEPVRVGGVKGLQFDVVLGDLPQNYNPYMFIDSRQPELRGPLQVKHWRTNFASLKETRHASSSWRT